MPLTLERVCKVVAGEVHLHPLDLELRPGMNVLLGATLAGKTSLLRIMAGLDRPSAGRLRVADRDVTGLPVRERDVAMVYQQFINYPSLTVFENLASPLRNRRLPEVEIRRRVGAMAEALQLSPFFARYPAELSGGQQQRTALARALVKGAGLLLLDEPLSNLDYKLREELRAELAALFAASATTVVYATTEPQEALLLGGTTAVLHEGRLLQQGPALDVFRRPTTLEAARAFSDPPLNVWPAVWRPQGGNQGGNGDGNNDSNGDGRLELNGSDVSFPAPPDARAALAGAAEPELQLAIRPHQIHLQRSTASDQKIEARVDLSEITGSESFLHLSRGDLALVLQVPGVQAPRLGAPCQVFLDPGQLYGFGRDGALLFGPDGARG